MDLDKKYGIAYKGLAPGSHEFEFQIDDSFFRFFPETDIRGGEAVVKVTLHKSEGSVVLDFTIIGKLKVECDRCLEEVEIPIESESRLQVRFSQTENECDGEVMWLSPLETVIPLAQYMYETLYLSLPYQRVHPENDKGESTCDADMLSRFRIVDQEEFDRLTAATESAASEGSPWEKLREIEK